MFTLFKRLKKSRLNSPFTFSLKATSRATLNSQLGSGHKVTKGYEDRYVDVIIDLVRLVSSCLSGIFRSLGNEVLNPKHDGLSPPPIVASPTGPIR